jgi:hypothetical protein
MAQPTLIPNCDGARFESLPLDTPRNRCILALDLGTSTGWALRSAEGLITSGTASFRPGRYDGGGMRYLRFTNWLTEVDRLSGPSRRDLVRGGAPPRRNRCKPMSMAGSWPR